MGSRVGSTGLGRASSALSSRTVRQAALYALSSGLGGVLHTVARALLARNMSVPAFGAFSFGFSFLQFAGLFFEFGLIIPAARLVARADDPRHRRELLGAALLMYVPVGLAFVAFVAGLSFVVDAIFRVDAGHALLITAPLAVAYPFILIGQQLAQGADRLHVFSVTNALSQTLFVAMLVVVVAADFGLGSEVALALRSATLLVGLITLAVWLRPVFSHTRAHLRTLRHEARRWGFQLYIGRVLSMSTYNMDVPMLGALTNARAVGLYSLAVTITAVLHLPVAALATALFGRMARAQRIERRWLVFSWVIAIFGFVLLTALAGPLVETIFGSSYAEAADYVLPLALAWGIRGVTVVYNTYLQSHGRGRELRNAGVALTISNLIFNLALIPPFGAAGAAWASALSVIPNFAAHVWGYRRALRDEAGEHQ